MILGLTGGIASGKSTVSRHLAQYGFPIVDADIGAREVVAKGSPGLERIQQQFGEVIIREDGTLNRTRLGKEIFEDSKKRQILNDLLAEDIRKWIEDKTGEAKTTEAPLIVLDIPLLFEAGYNKVVDQTMVVAVYEDIQLKRLMNRDGLSREEALKRIKAQMPLEKKIKQADVVIDNNGTIDETKKQIDNWLLNQGILTQSNK